MHCNMRSNGTNEVAEISCKESKIHTKKCPENVMFPAQ